MRATTLLISAALTMSASAAVAQSNYNVVVEPVTSTVEAIINAPVEYDDNGVVKAQHFNADNLTPSQYQELLDEADRIRAYRSANGINFESEYVAVAPVAQATTTYQSSPSFQSAPSYQIDLFAPDTTTTTSATKTHTVSKGDTLYNISKRYDASVAAIKTENGLSGNTLSLGQRLLIPGVVVESINTVAQPIYATTTSVAAPLNESYVTRRVVQTTPVTIAPQIAPARVSAEAVYAVLPKDTLYSISRRTCVGVKDIISYNRISNPNALTPGQRISLPEGHCLSR